MNPFAEQEAWEDHQIGKATLKFGAKNKQASDDYQFVFEDQINFIKESVMAGENYEDAMDAKQRSQDLAEKTALEELQVLSFFYFFSLTLFDQTQPPDLLFRM
jgi:pre-mRNA-splicing factor ATP-dependent RNA helicase DHX16